MCFLYFFFLRYVFSHSQNAMCENTRRQCKEKPEEARILYTFTELYLTSCNYHGFTLSINFNLSYAET